MNFIPINDFYSGSTGTQNNIHYPIKNIFLPGHIHKFQLLFGLMLQMEHSVSNISLKYHWTCLLRMATKCGKKMPFYIFCHIGCYRCSQGSTWTSTTGSTYDVSILGMIWNLIHFTRYKKHIFDLQPFTLSLTLFVMWQF